MDHPDHLPESRPPRQPLVPPGSVDLHEQDLTATFAADVPLRVAQERLTALNQWLPIDGDPDTPLGRLVEINSTGPLRLGYGAWRDLLLGVQFTNGRGELITAGGRTVKNVAGYDLTKLMVGQHGVFGRLVALTARTWRRPDGALAARFAADPAVLSRLLPTPLRPQWAMLRADALWCGYLGDEAALAFYRERIEQGVRQAAGEAQPVEVIYGTLEDDRLHRSRFNLPTAGEGFRASVPPARVLDFVSRAGLEDWTADAAFGIVTGPVVSEAQRPRLREAAEGVGGRVLFSRPDPAGPSAPAMLEFSTTPGERQIIERLKQAFDPDATLTPLPWQSR